MCRVAHNPAQIPLDRLNVHVAVDTSNRGNNAKVRSNEIIALQVTSYQMIVV